MTTTLDLKFDTASVDSLSVCATSVVTEATPSRPVHRSETTSNENANATTSPRANVVVKEPTMSTAEERRADALEEILRRGKFDGWGPKRHSFPADSPPKGVAPGKGVRFQDDGEFGLKAEINRLMLRKKEETSHNNSKGESKVRKERVVDSLESVLGMADDEEEEDDDDDDVDEDDEEESSQLSTIAEDLEGEKQIAALQEEKDQLDHEMRRLRNELSDEKNLRVSTEKERDVLKTKIHTVEEEVNRLQRENEQLWLRLERRSRSREGSTEPRPAFPTGTTATTHPHHHSHHPHHPSSRGGGGGGGGGGGIRSSALPNSQLAISMPDVAKGSEGFKPYGAAVGDKRNSALTSSNTSLTHASGSLAALSPNGSQTNLDADPEVQLSADLQRSLAESLRGCTSVQQLLQAVLAHANTIQGERTKQALLERDRLKSRLARAEAEIDLLRLNVAECRDFAERYSLASRQFEANATILAACLAFTTRVAAIYEKAVALLEAEENLVAVACRLAKQPNPREIVAAALKQDRGLSSEGLSAARHVTARLRSAEADARDLLQSFTFGSPTHDGSSSQTSGYSSDMHYWDDKSPIFSRTSSNSTSGSVNGLVALDTDSALHDVLTKLKDQAMGLKLQRTKRERALVDVEIEGFPDVPPELACFNPHAQIERDFEHALLLLELATVKDDKVDLKAKTYLQEQELKSYELQMNTFAAQEQSYIVHIEHLKSEVKDQTRKKRRLQKELRELQGKRPDTPSQSQDDRSTSSSVLSMSRTMSLDRPQPAGSSNPSPTSSADLQATQLQKEIAELQRRERSLRLRNHELAESLERYTKSFQAKNDQQQIYEADLKRAHDSLVTAYNKLKRRFQLQQKLHEEEIASLRKEIVRVQSGDIVTQKADKLRYLEFSQEETQL